jgi:hypothetical protein
MVIKRNIVAFPSFMKNLSYVILEKFMISPLITLTINAD